MVSPERIPDAREQTLLSAVVRVSGREGAAALDETFFSLAIQDWRDLEVVVALAGGGGGPERRVAEAVESQPWPGAPRYRILPAGGGDAGRGALLSRAVGEASGRFMAFLNAGEVVVYQHGYAALVGRLAESGSGVALGGCRSAHLRGEPGREFVETKDDFTLAPPPLGLLGKKFAPVCSHVVDRSRVADSALRLAAGATGANWERDFLARLYAAAAPDDTLRHVFVCERRLRAGGLEGMLYAAARRARALREAARRARGRLRGAVSRGAR